MFTAPLWHTMSKAKSPPAVCAWVTAAAQSLLTSLCKSLTQAFADLSNIARPLSAPTRLPDSLWIAWQVHARMACRVWRMSIWSSTSSPRRSLSAASRRLCRCAGLAGLRSVMQLAATCSIALKAALHLYAGSEMIQAWRAHQALTASRR